MGEISEVKIGEIRFLPLISIIIPVYNVEKYLEQCLNTVINQTYRSLEIIIVDDGSTDNSKDICADFAKRDHRIQLIHKTNGGQASARNVAIRAATGDYLFFVDSDDLLALNCIERELQILLENDADCVQGEFRRFWKEKEIVRDDTAEKVIISKFDTEGAIEAFCYQDFFYPAPWGKLIKRSVWGDVLFREKIGYEDFDVSYKVLGKIAVIIHTNEILYYYRIHKESTQHEAYSLRKKDRIDISNELLEYIQMNFPRIEKAAKVRYQLSRMQYLMELPLGKEYDGERKDVFEEVKKYRKDCLQDNKSKTSFRLMLLCSFFGANIFSRLGRIYAKVTRR